MLLTNRTTAGVVDVNALNAEEKARSIDANVIVLVEQMINGLGENTSGAHDNTQL